MFRAIKRSFTEGVRGMAKNGLMTVTSLLVVTACIFVFGVFLMCIFNINHMTEKMADSYQVDVYVSRGVPVDTESIGVFIEEDPSLTQEQYEEKIDAIQTSLITDSDNIDTESIRFVSADERYEEFLSTLSEKERKKYDKLTDMPLEDSFTVSITDSKKQIETLRYLNEIEGVSRVLDGSEIYAVYAGACGISANMSESRYESIKAKVRKEIEKIPNIDLKNITVVDGIEYFKNFKEELTEEERKDFEGLPDDVISDAFEIRLIDLKKAEETIAALSAIENVESVENSREIIAMIEDLKDSVKTISIWIIVAFALVSLFIISNTIKLTVHNRRKEINIMKYVGATDSYIRGPFIMEGILLGILSAIIAFFISKWCYDGLMTAITTGTSALPISSLMSFSLMWGKLLGAYVITGTFIGAFGSFISVRRYMNV